MSTATAASLCSVAECAGAAARRGLCAAHYQRLITLGDVRAERPIRRQLRGTLAERFWPRVVVSEDPDDCWDWLGSFNTAGYPRIAFGGGYVLATRVSYELHSGPIPEGLNILHGCDNPPCCNPRHLRAGTQASNVADMYERGRRR